MRDVVLVLATVMVALGLVLILWRGLSHATERRTVGPVRDTFEVLLPIAATVGLVVWVWIA